MKIGDLARVSALTDKRKNLQRLIQYVDGAPIKLTAGYANGSSEELMNVLDYLEPRAARAAILPLVEAELCGVETELKIRGVELDA